LINNAFAQFRLADRHEIFQEKINKYEFKVIPLKEKGVAVFSVKEPWSYDKNKEFKFEMMDTSLTVLVSKSFMLPYIMTEPNRIFYDDDKFLYFFAQEKLNLEITIWKLNILNFENEIFTAKLPLKMDVLDFQVSEEVAYMIGNYNDKSVAISFNFVDKLPKVLPSFFEEKEEVREIQADNRGNQMNFVISHSSHRNCKLFVKPYSNLIGGKKRLEIKYNNREDPNRTPRQTKVFSIDGTKQLLLGTYSLDCSDNVQGLFSANYDNGEQNNLTYYKFTEFKNFFSYHSEKRNQKMQEKVSKMNEKGKDFLLNRKFYLHPKIYEKGDELVMVMEGYYTQSPNNNNWNRRNWWMSNYYYPGLFNYFSNSAAMNPALWNNRQWNNNNSPAVNNYAYTIISSFDKKGRKLWDNAMKIEDIESTMLLDVVKIGTWGDSVIMAYMKDNEIYSKLIHKNKTQKAEGSQKLKKILEGYQLNFDEDDSNFLHWYGHYFLLFGEQKSTHTDDEGNRKLFHISKLEYTSLPPDDEKAKSKSKSETNDKKEK
jgi:hypothetical protein